MPRKPTLSPTRIATYLECAMKYRYIYVDKIGRFYTRARPEYSFGSTLHQVLQAFHAEGGVKSAEELAEDVSQRWVSAGYESAEQEQQFRAAGADIAHAYHAAAQARAALPVETFMTEKPIRTDMGRFVLMGRVDRVDRHADGALEIVDYKSGRTEVSPDDVAGSLAMSIYQLILRRMYPGTRVFGTIIALRSGESASYEMNDDEAERFVADITELGTEIVERDLEGVEPQRIDACEGCEFRSVCERFWRKQEGNVRQ